VFSQVRYRQRILWKSLAKKSRVLEKLAKKAWSRRDPLDRIANGSNSASASAVASPLRDPGELATGDDLQRAKCALSCETAPTLSSD
jgi:hypothetical protein